MVQYTGRFEYARERKIRARNRPLYRLAHWPIWITVFFLAPGPLTFQLFAHGPDRRNLLWLMVVLLGTGIAGFFGQLPGVEPRPYIIRFCEDKPNPKYRRICYTFAWNALLNFVILNLLGLMVAVETGVWRMRQIYHYGYLPMFLIITAGGIFAVLPRVKRSTIGEGTERRYFYAAVWAIPAAQAVLLVLWKTLPRTHSADIIKLLVYTAMLGGLGTAACCGWLPRTRPILPSI